MVARLSSAWKDARREDATQEKRMLRKGWAKLVTYLTRRECTVWGLLPGLFRCNAIKLCHSNEIRRLTAWKMRARISQDIQHDSSVAQSFLVLRQKDWAKIIGNRDGSYRQSSFLAWSGWWLWPLMKWEKMIMADSWESKSRRGARGNLLDEEGSLVPKE